MDEPRITLPLLRILQQFLADPTHPRYGLDIVRDTGLKSGTVYPILKRLTSIGWLEAIWEDIDPSESHRPRRRYYSLTPAGRLAAPARASAALGATGSYSTYRAGLQAWI
jgi:DNA-binding PadR family transcriptional regulator